MFKYNQSFNKFMSNTIDQNIDILMDKSPYYINEPHKKIQTALNNIKKYPNSYENVVKGSKIEFIEKLLIAFVIASFYLMGFSYGYECCIESSVLFVIFSISGTIYFKYITKYFVVERLKYKLENLKQVVDT